MGRLIRGMLATRNGGAPEGARHTAFQERGKREFIYPMKEISTPSAATLPLP